MHMQEPTSSYHRVPTQEEFVAHIQCLEGMGPSGSTPSGTIEEGNEE